MGMRESGGHLVQFIYSSILKHGCLLPMMRGEEEILFWNQNHNSEKFLTFTVDISEEKKIGQISL